MISTASLLTLATQQQFRKTNAKGDTLHVYKHTNTFVLFGMLHQNSPSPPKLVMLCVLDRQH